MKQNDRDPFAQQGGGFTREQEEQLWQQLSFSDGLTSFYGDGEPDLKKDPRESRTQDDYGYGEEAEPVETKPEEHRKRKSRVRITLKKKKEKKKKEKTQEDTEKKNPLELIRSWIKALTGFWIRLSMAARISVIAAFGIVLLLIALFGISFAPQEQEVPRIAKGVTIDGYEVSGMTREEAQDALRRVLDEKFAGVSIILVYGEDQWTFEAKELGLSDDLESVIDKAMAIRPPARLFDRIVELFKRKSDARDLHTSVIVSEVLLHAKLTQECGIADETVVDGNVSFDAKAVNEQGLFTITAPRSGRSINMSRLISEIRNAISEGGVHEIAITETVVHPKNTLADLKLSVSKIAETELSMAGATETQKKNATAAIQRLDGTVIDAGSKLSLNAVTGNYTVENGYELVEAESGYDVPGLEYAATVYYRAALLANMDMLTRFSPDAAVEESQPGLDATLSAAKDLVLRNTSDYPLYISAKAEGDTLRITVYGMPLENGQTITLETEILSYAEAPAPDQVTDDGTYGLAPGETLEVTPSRRGCTVRLWRVYKDRFGNEISRTQIGQSTTYSPIRGTTVTGPEA